MLLEANIIFVVLARAMIAGFVVILGGCFEAEQASSPERKVTLQLSARKRSFRGWRDCYEVSNGLVTLTLAPSIGGRAVQFRLLDSNFFFLGKEELGKTYRGREFHYYHFFGGAYLQLHPESRWGSTSGALRQVLLSDYPPHFYMGEYRIVSKETVGGRAVTVLEGPYARVREKETGKYIVVQGDPATRVFVRRRFELPAYSSKVLVEESIRSISRKPQLWGVWEVIQLRGRSSEDGVLSLNDRADGTVWVYLPLNPKSKFDGGFFDILAGQPAGKEAEKQWVHELAPGVLAVQYLGRFGRIGVDAPKTWAVFYDQERGIAFAVRSRYRKGLYPDGGCTVEIATHGGRTAYPMVEIYLFGPAKRLKPGEGLTARFEWAGTRCEAPIRDVMELGVVSQPLKLLKENAGWRIRGSFGVFYWARTRIVFLDSANRVLGKAYGGLATPLSPYTLDAPIEVPAGTSKITLSLYTLANAKLGDLAYVRLPED